MYNHFFIFFKEAHSIHSNTWIFSQEASHFGSLLSGIGTLLLAGLGIYGYRRWQKERRFEKLSDIAQEALDHCESSLSQAKDWIDEIYFAYDRNSNGNKEIIDKLVGDEKKAFQQMLKEDPYEIRNFCKRFKKVSLELSTVSSRATRLENPTINSLFEPLLKIFKHLPAKVARYLRDDCPNTEKQRFKNT